MNNQKDWRLCSTKGCINEKAGQYAKYCHECIAKRKEVGKYNQILRLIVKVKI